MPPLPTDHPALTVVEVGVGAPPSKIDDDGGTDTSGGYVVLTGPIEAVRAAAALLYKAVAVEAVP